MPSPTQRTSHQNANRVRSPSATLPKARSHESLPQAYTLPPSHALHRPRLCSEPIQALKRQGIIQCDSMSIEEAWSRFGIRVPRSDADSKALHVREECISPRSKPSRLPVATRKTSDLPEKRGCSYDSNISTLSEQHMRKSESVAQSIKSAFQSYRLSGGQRNASKARLNGTKGLHMPVPFPPTSIGPNRQPSGRVKLGVQEIPFLSRSMTKVQRKGTKIVIIKEQAVKNRADLQCQIGRPTGCDDSPYSVAKRKPLHSTVPIETSGRGIMSRLPVFRITARQEDGPPAVRIVGRCVAKATPSEHLPRPVLRSDHVSASSESESDYSDNSCATYSECSDASTSLQSQTDEAEELWRSLESSLGVVLQCQTTTSDKKKDRSAESRRSRLPRLPPGKVLTGKSDIRPSSNAPPSRLPVASRLAKKLCDKKLERDPSLITQTISLLRSTSYATTPSRSDSICTSSSVSYIGFLPPLERDRREEAQKRRNWGERTLRVY